MSAKYAEIDLLDEGDIHRIRIYGMGTARKTAWLVRLAAVIARAGVKGGPAAFSSMLDKEMKEAKAGGQFLLQLPGLTFEDIQALLAPLLSNCRIVRTDPASGKTVTVKLNSDAKISANIKSIAALMKLRWEAFKHNFVNRENKHDDRF